MSVCIYTQGRIKPYDHALNVVGFFTIGFVYNNNYFLVVLHDQLVWSTICHVHDCYEDRSVLQFFEEILGQFQPNLAQNIFKFFRGGLEEKL